jgi:hypothetical protein
MRHPLTSANSTALIRLCSYGSHTPPHRSWLASASQNSSGIQHSMCTSCEYASWHACAQWSVMGKMETSRIHPAYSNCSHRSARVEAFPCCAT